MTCAERDSLLVEQILACLASLAMWYDWTPLKNFLDQALASAVLVGSEGDESRTARGCDTTAKLFHKTAAAVEVPQCLVGRESAGQRGGPPP
mmetsp:Transcript_15816/g.43246  ORF Transcript_15816/g.43246 Transcript_15816/m.43246 type:complete len:92 (-) Transcript_15816:297-572(-)